MFMLMPTFTEQSVPMLSITMLCSYDSCRISLHSVQQLNMFHFHVSLPRNGNTCLLLVEPHQVPCVLQTEVFC